MTAVVHNTFVLTRTYAHPLARVFAAFSTPEKKRRWYAASGAHDVVSYELSFTRGGKEELVGKMKPGTPIAGAIIVWSHAYVDIVDGRRIVFTQTVDIGKDRISCALITVEFRPEADGCALLFTHQAAYFDGADGPHMREMGWRVLLDAIPAALE